MARPEKTSPKPAASRAEAVRSAVDQAFQATAGRAEVTGRRAQEIADELAGAVTRLRDVLDDARPVTAADLDALRAEVASVASDVAALGRRVTALEAEPQAPAAAKAPAAKRQAPRSAGPAGKPAAKKPAGRASAASRVPAARAAARRQADQRGS
jgi:polyhydroxyalkanoate synthesis regulator phasin